MFKECAMLNMNTDALRSHIYGNHKAFLREFGLGDLSCHSKMQFHTPRYCKLRNNPNLNAKHKQICNKVTLTPKCKQLHVQTIPAGNSKQFCKSVKLLNCKRASTFPVIIHDGKRIACDGQEGKKANILNHFFHSYKWSVITVISVYVDLILNFDLITIMDIF